MSNLRNYGTTRQIVTGRVQTIREWCAVNPEYPVTSPHQSWYAAQSVAEFAAANLGRQVVQRMRTISTSYITEEVSRRAELQD